MKTMKKIITLSIATLLIATLGSNISIAAKPTGGNGKVTVESANPNSAVQGEEKDVLISGSGFGHGAKVKYLVTGTKDDSQIEVLTVEYIEATGELKSRIKVKGSAEVIDYDIEVQSISGRKGKGTTLFKVSRNPESCTGTFPAIAYMTKNWTDDIFDVVLLDSEGCKQYDLLKDEPNGGGVHDVRLTYHAPYGVIVWVEDVYVDPDASVTSTFSRIWGLGFEVIGGEVVADNPIMFVETEIDGFIIDAQIYFDASGEAALTYYKNRVGDPKPRGLFVLSGFTIENLGSATSLSGREDTCVQLDIYGNCSTLRYARMRWSADGSAVYFSSLGETDALVKANVVDGLITTTEVLLPIPDLRPYGFSRDDSLLVSAFTGRLKGNKRAMDVRVFPVAHCIQIGCNKEDGELILNSDTYEISNREVRWSSSDSILWYKQNSAGRAEIREFSLSTGTIRTLYTLNLSNSTSLDSVDTVE